MKASEIREMSVDELNEKLASLKEELFALRFQLAINQLDNTAMNLANVNTTGFKKTELTFKDIYPKGHQN